MGLFPLTDDGQHYFKRITLRSQTWKVRSWFPFLVSMYFSTELLPMLISPSVLDWVCQVLWRISWNCWKAQPGSSPKKCPLWGSSLSHPLRVLGDSLASRTRWTHCWNAVTGHSRSEKHRTSLPRPLTPAGSSARANHFSPGNILASKGH